MIEKTTTAYPIEQTVQDFEVSGQFGMDVIGGLIGIALAALLFMYIAVIGGKSFSVFEEDITAIGDVNSGSGTIYDFDGTINSTSVASFETIEELTDLLPIFGFLFVFGALAIIITSLAGGFSGGGGRTMGPAL